MYKSITDLNLPNSQCMNEPIPSLLSNLSKVYRAEKHSACLVLASLETQMSEARAIKEQSIAVSASCRTVHHSIMPRQQVI